MIILPIRNWVHSLRLRRLRLTHLFHHISDPQLVNVNFYMVGILLLILAFGLGEPVFGLWLLQNPVRVLV
jgi:hypothetical protein